MERQIILPTALIADSELTNLVNYDVSYVDDMTSPVAMYAKRSLFPSPIFRMEQPHARWNNDDHAAHRSGPQPGFSQLLTTTYPYGDGTNDTYQWLVQYDVPGLVNELFKSEQ